MFKTIIGQFKGVGGATPWLKIFGNKNAIKSEFLPPPQTPLENFGAGGPEKFFEKSLFFFSGQRPRNTKNIEFFWTKNGLKQAKNPLKLVKKGFRAIEEPF